MKKYLLTTTAAGAALALSAPSMAGDWYITGFGGTNMLDDNGGVSLSSVYVDISGGPSYTTWGTKYVTKGFTWGTWSTATGSFEFDDGFVIGAAIGQECDCIDGLSFEGEIAYRKNDVDLSGMAYMGYFQHKYYMYVTTEFLTSSWTKSITKHNTFTTFSTTDTGEITAFSIMANAWYEFGSGGSITPYVGGGVGWAKVDLEVGDWLDADDSGMAWQVAAGVSLDMSATTSVRLEYRYFAVPGLELMHDGADLGVDYEASSIIVGLKVNF